MSEIIRVGDIKVELEVRNCVGGCGRQFKVSAESQHQTYFTDCEERCRKKYTVFSHKKKFNPSHGATFKRDWRSCEQREDFWL